MITTVLHTIYFINYQLVLKRPSFEEKKLYVNNTTVLNEEYLTDYDDERLEIRIIL